ncbi:MAG TPA: hypothetical protein VM325_01410 [Alphaproteobacteria bacterium]|nr:hypothetical protein [Alphaproteobacteria bacterium]
MALPAYAAEPARASAPAQLSGIQLAQGGPPVRLAPRDLSGGTTARPPTERRGGIREERLGHVNPESVGVLDDGKGGLGSGLWAGTPRATVVAMMGRLPLRYRSPALRDLARRLLLTQATAPQGLIVGQSLVTLRLERLYGMGDLKGAEALVKAAPSTLSGPRLAMLQVNTALLAGDAKNACAAVDRHLPAHDTLPLQRANVVCLALAKETDKASLALSLLREQDGIPDEIWERLVEAAAQGQKPTGKTAEPAVLKLPTPGQLALLAALKLPLPAGAAKTDDLAILRAIAMMKDAPPALRLQAGEKAADAGALSAADLARVYAAVPIEADEIAKAVALARETFDARARARLFKAAAQARDPRKRAKILRAVWTLARKHGGYAVAARVFGTFVADMAPDPDLRRFAPYAARALYSAGEVQLATAWYRLLLAGPPNDAAAHLWPIARLAAPDQILWDDGRLQHWVRLQRRDGRRPAARRITILRALFTATGDADAAATDWQALLPSLTAARTGGAIPRLWRGMRAAAVAQRRGQTVLALLTGIESGDLSKLDGVDLRLVLRSLRDVALTGELRAVALEAALANRL